MISPLSTRSPTAEGPQQSESPARSPLGPLGARGGPAVARACVLSPPDIFQIDAGLERKRWLTGSLDAKGEWFHHANGIVRVYSTREDDWPMRDRDAGVPEGTTISLKYFLAGLLPWTLICGWVAVFGPIEAWLRKMFLLDVALPLGTSYCFVMGARLAWSEPGVKAKISRWLNVLGLAICLAVVAYYAFLAYLYVYHHYSDCH